MSENQRKIFAEGFVSLANIVAGAMIFGQFVTGQKIDFAIVALGVLFAMIFYFWAYIFSKSA